MTKTYTPLIIEGKIYVVVDAPEKPKPSDTRQLWYARLNACTKYETLPEHAPYWEERIGQQVEVEIWSEPPVDAYDFDSNGYFLEEEYEQALLDHDDTEYAIPKRQLPPQQKQGDDLWDEAEKGCKALPPDQPYGAYSYTTILNYLKSNYSLKRKL